MEACSNGRRAPHAIDGVDDVGAAAGGRAARVTEGLPFTDPALRMFSWLSTTVATSERRTGAPLLIGDDQRGIFLGDEKLIVVVQNESCARASESAPLGALALAAFERGAHLVQARRRACSAEAD